MSSRARRIMAGACLSALGSLVPAVVAASQQFGTAAEAQALVASAVARYAEAGREAAFAAFEDRAGDFVDRDLYIFVFGPARTIVAHGGDPQLVGTRASSLEDGEGVRFGDRFMDEATEDGVWIDYHWLDPVSGEALPKRSWVVLYDGHVFGAGVYRRQE